MIPILNSIVCAGIWWSVLCRGAASNGEANPQIRRAFVLLSVAAFIAGVVPFIHPGYVLESQLALGVAIGYLQWVTGRFWRHGTPAPFVT